MVQSITSCFMHYEESRPSHETLSIFRQDDILLVANCSNTVIYIKNNDTLTKPKLPDYCDALQQAHT
jgi:hypothetical protein